MKKYFIFGFLILLVACSIDPVRPQAIFEATTTARAQLREIIQNIPPIPTIEPKVFPRKHGNN